MYINVLEQLGVTDTSNSGLHIETCEEWRRQAREFYSVLRSKRVYFVMNGLKRK